MSLDASEPPTSVAMSLASGPPAAVTMSMASEPPASVTMELTNERAGSADPQEVVTEPPELEIDQEPQARPAARAPRGLEGLGIKDLPSPEAAWARDPSLQSFSLPRQRGAAPAAPASVPAAPAVPASTPGASAVPVSVPATSPRAPSLPARLLAWVIDFALLAACAAAHVLLAIEMVGPARLAPHGSGSPDYWLDLLIDPGLSLLWAALAACLAVSYSWLFAALGGRTPGMALARLRLVTTEGAPPTPARALARAALSLTSAAGLLGFTIALFDERGQTLHDKLAGTQIVPE